MNSSTELRSERSLVEERAVNERYRRELHSWLLEQKARFRGQSASRSQFWTNPGALVQHLDSTEGPLVGRVALDAADEDLGDGFYVGPRNLTWDGPFVMSWAAPMCSLFYVGPDAKVVIASDVIARRTFVVEHDDIVAYVDEIDRADSGADPFAERSEAHRLSVPAPPVQLRIEQPTRHVPRVPPPVPIQPPVERKIDRVPAKILTTGVTPGPKLRAEAALRAVLDRPRTGHLSSVLATLQPEQYRLVTWPDNQALIVQGQPGTGKTIIAAHRAAYLTHPDREREAVGTLGFFGPTQRFAEHVGQVLREIAVGEVGVVAQSLPWLFARLAGLGTVPAPDDGSEEQLDASWELARLLKRAASVLRKAARLRPRNETRDLVDAVCRLDRILASLLAAHPDLTPWLTTAGSYERCRQSERYLPFLAAASLAAQPPPSSALYDHLIIDEAQDVRPLEWRILLDLLKEEGQMSLFGDVNQRRSDYSFANWDHLARDLAISDEEGRCPLQELQTAFRTTGQILRYANRLLPRGERAPQAIRTGPDPVVRRVSADQLPAAVLHEAEQLAGRYPAGLTAVITNHPQLVSDRIRNAGWTRGHQAWTRDELKVVVLSPPDARGLEYDGVVVVEPAEFPQNVGRSGPLYTSLTRAVQELTVVHARPLPSGLPSGS